MRAIAAITICVSLAGCKREAPDASKIASPGTASHITTTTQGDHATARRVSPREMELIEQVVAMFPGERGAELRRNLLDQSVARIRLTAHPDAQRLLSRIDSIRQVRLDSSIAALKTAPRSVVRASIALLDNWEQADVAAIALLRPGQDPSDLILLDRGARAADLAAGVRALVSAYEKSSSPRNAVRIVVQKSAIPASWRREGLDLQAEEQLRLTRQAGAVELEGIGRARITQINVRIGGR